MTSWALALRALRHRVSWRDEHTRNLLSFLVCRVCAIGFFGLSVAYFMRSRNSSEYGTIALLFGMFSYITMLDLGIGYAVNLRFAKALARGRRDPGQIVSSAISLFLVIGALLSVGIFAAGPQISSLLLGTPRYAAAIEVLGASAILILVSSVLTSVVQAYNRIDLANYSRLFLDAVKVAALVVAASAPRPVVTAMWVLLGGMILKTGFDLILLRYVSGGIRCVVPSWDQKELRINVGFGLPMAAASVVSMIFWTGDRVYVSRALGAMALTAYSIGADVCSKAFLLVTAVTRSVYIVLIRRKAVGIDSSMVMKISMASVVAVAVLFYLPLLVFAPQLLGAWVGPEVAARSIAVTRIWCIASVAYLGMTVFYNYLQAAGRPRALLAVNVGTALAMLAALFGVPGHWSIEGVGAIVCVTFALQAVVTWMLAERARELAPKRISR